MVKLWLTKWFTWSNLSAPNFKLNPNSFKWSIADLLVAINLLFSSQKNNPFGNKSIPSLNLNNSTSCFFVSFMSVANCNVEPSGNLDEDNK